MLAYNNFINSIDVSTRDKRRKSLKIAIGLLENIRKAEEDNIDRFPLNLQNSEAFANAEHSLDILLDSIGALGDAY